MSANLDKSLDDLVSGRRQNVRNTRRRAGGRRAATKPAVGGVKKSTKAAPKPAHPTPIVQASSKILVSGLVRSDYLCFDRPVRLLTFSACRCFRGQYQGMLI